MTTYTNTQEYIEQNLAPGLGDIELTQEQALEVAQAMTEWDDSGRLVERQDMDFWDVVAKVLGDD